MTRSQFSLKTLLWLMALVAAFLGGRAMGIQGERKRLPAELLAEKNELQRLEEEAKHLNRELNKRIVEWIEEANILVKRESAEQERKHSGALFSGPR